MVRPVSLSGSAWALLDMLNRDGRGGPVPDGLSQQFAELRVNGLARMSGAAMKITEAGATALRGRIVEGVPGRWAFIRHHDVDNITWLWQRFGPDGRIEKTSEPQANYGKALIDALNHGFRPNEHDYSVDLPKGKLHYPPGRDPEISKNGAVNGKASKDRGTRTGGLPEDPAGAHRVVGSYTTRRDGGLTYRYQVRWTRYGNHVTWEAYVFLEGKLVGQPSKMVRCPPSPDTGERIVRASLEKAIETSSRSGALKAG